MHIAGIKVEVLRVETHQTRQQHTLDRFGRGGQMITVHKDALLRGVLMQVEVHQ